MTWHDEVMRHATKTEKKGIPDTVGVRRWAPPVYIRIRHRKSDATTEYGKTACGLDSLAAQPA
jgi:hypothetical protein